MSCLTAFYCAVLLGGVTTHLTNDYAPENGYNWNNKTVGIEIEQKKEGIYYGATASVFKDSFNRASNTQLFKVGYRFDDNIAAGVGAGHVKTSYYNNLLAAPYIDLCKDFACVTILGIPKVYKNDAFINANFKIRF